MNVVPAHEVVIQRFAELAHEEIKSMAFLARQETNRGFSRIRRSVGAVRGWDKRRNHG